MIRRRALLAAPVLLAASPAPATSLRMGVATTATSLDPHFFSSSPNMAVAAHGFETLVAMDEEQTPRPGLAEAWTPLASDVWEFKLRPGVPFQSGEILQAQHVITSLKRALAVQGSPGSFAGNVRPIKEMRAADPLTVRFQTDGTVALLPALLSSVAIMDDAGTGTGPYQVVEFVPNGTAQFRRFGGYWGARPAWDAVERRFIPNDAARLAALLAGDVDIIDQVPTQAMERLAAAREVQIDTILSNRLIYLTLNLANDDPAGFVRGADGAALARNPLRDLRVRQAISLAIDRRALVERVMQGFAGSTGQFAPPGRAGTSPSLGTPVADPAAARALLAAAGYPDGLQLTLHGPADRYPNGAQTVQAIAQMLRRAGIKAEVDVMPWTVFLARLGRNEFAVSLAGFGASSGEASGPLRALLASRDAQRGTGTFNRGGYSNPALDRALDSAMNEAAAGPRERLLQSATELAAADLGIIPLYFLKPAWASRAGVSYRARADEFTLAQSAAPR